MILWIVFILAFSPSGEKMVCGEMISVNSVFVLHFLRPGVFKVLSKRIDCLAVLVGF